MDDLEPEHGMRYRPLERTPPEYQTVIKFLLMASILDSVWVSGPPTTGSPCGLVRPPGDLDLQSAPIFGEADDAVPDTTVVLPHNVLEALRLLNISAEHCVRHRHRQGNNELRVGGVAPAVLRVLSVILFNAFVFWSDFGAALVTPTAGATPRWLEVGSSDVGGPKGGWTGTGAGERGWTEDSAEVAFARAGVAGVAAFCNAKPATSTVTSGSGTSARETAGAGTGRLGGDTSASKTSRKAAASELDDQVDVVHVPWVVQLFYVVTLVVLMIGMPCCPTVLENACTFLTCG